MPESNVNSLIEQSNAVIYNTQQDEAYFRGREEEHEDPRGGSGKKIKAPRRSIVKGNDKAKKNLR
jgi:hypothetical protein